MIKVLIPSDSEFKNYEKQLKKMYEENQEKITDTNSFQFIIRNTLFYTFIQDGTLIGAIYCICVVGFLFSQEQIFIIDDFVDYIFKIICLYF